MKRNWILTIIILAYFMIIMDTSVIFTSLDTMSRELGLSVSASTWVQDAYTLFFGGLLVLGAQIGTVLGKRRIFIAGLVIFGAASVAVGLGSAPSVLIIARALQGVGAAIIAPTSLALITEHFEEGEERAKATRLYGATAGIGSAVGMIFGGLVTTYISWRFAFFINAPIAIALTYIALRVLPADKARSTVSLRSFDIFGAFLATLGLGAISFGIMESMWWISILGGLVLVAFGWYETRAAHPIIPPAIIKHPVRGPMGLGRFFFAATVMPFFLLASQLMGTHFGFSALAIGLAFSANAIPQFLLAMNLRRIQARWGIPTVVIAGLIMTATGVAAMIPLNNTGGSVLLLLLIYAWMGVGQGLAFATLTSLGIYGASAEDSGAASGVVNSAHQLGATIGLPIVMSMANPFIGSTVLILLSIAFAAWGALNYVSLQRSTVAAR
ncbi:MAG: MFS transporter [Corynebacterium sp.]|nr:MFS transporter [Corynebacterium sp.]